MTCQLDAVTQTDAQNIKGSMRIAGALSRAARRFFRWDTLGVVASIGLMTAAGFALFHLLRDIGIAQIGAALAAMPVSAVIVAGLFVAASYVTMTFYDFFALRTIGHRHIPYRVAGLTGFMAYAIAHNVGATMFTANLIRYRVYREWGLTLIDIAKVAFVTGLTFWLGNIVVLGACLAYAPEAAGAINELPPALVRTLALTALAIIGLYLLWLLPRPRTFSRGEWTLTLPSARLTLLQIGIGIADLGLAAIAMTILVLAQAQVDIVSVVVSYVVGVLLGFASHAPGGIGVFDVTMLLALPQIPKEKLLAALLAFRCLYFLLPFCVAFLAFVVRELWISTAPGGVTPK